MKTKILPAIVTAVILSSCSSAYKSGQTPDDLYYSPAREVTVSNEHETRKEKKYREDDYVYEDELSANDRLLRMKIANRKFSTLDDYTYWNDIRYSNSCNCTCNNNLTFVWFEGRYYPVRSYGYNTFNNPFSPYGSYKYYSWNNPYYYPVNYVKTVTPARPSRSLVDTYKNPNYDNSNRPVWSKGGYTNGSSNSNTYERRTTTTSGSTTDRSVRTFETNTNKSSNSSSSNTNSNAGGNSGGYKSTGSSSSSGRPPRNQ